jgi:hypothetical protein
VGGEGREVFGDCQVVPVVKKPKPQDPGVAEHAFDEKSEERLWVKSKRMVGL